MTVTNLMERIKNSRQGISIVTHERPDVDALGSCSGLGWVFHQMGLPTNITVESWVSFSRKLRPYNNADSVDLQVVVDVHEPERTFGFNDVLPTIIVDHHSPSKNFNGNAIIDPASCATASLLTELFTDQLDKRSATCFLAGTLADTGVLAYSNVDVRCLDDVITLVDTGAQWDEAYKEATKICGIVQAKRVAMLLSKVIEYKPGIFILTINREDRIENGYTDSDFSIALSIMQWIGKGFLFATMREAEDGKFVNLSFRSREPFEAIKYALAFGGGGHRMAAAAKISEPLVGCLPRVESLIDQDAATTNYIADEKVRDIDMELAEMYRRTDLLSNGIDINGLKTIRSLLEKGARAEEAAKIVRQKIDLNAIHSLAQWVLKSDDLSDYSSFLERIFARQVDKTCLV
ncbi:DHH family phosphoesterase [Coprothermobacter platensis]|uniref:DHH family phosphoesterase n=1 Tax=Coprothermobacter platensis TaxID=108819 RepID=UPI001FE02921|nr:DHH family phosphoesterase [Coprothermobacter platensis]